MTNYRTHDYFNFKDEEMNLEYANKCICIAKRCGLNVSNICWDAEFESDVIHLLGKKPNFILYYIKTLKYNESLLEAIKRILHVICWH